MCSYDCIVLGKGAVGLSTIFHLLQKGCKVLCIDDSKKHFDVMASYASGAMLGAISELSHLNLLGGMEEETFVDARNYHNVFQKNLAVNNDSSYKIKDGIFVIAGGAGGEQDYTELKHQLSVCNKYKIKYEHVNPYEIPGYMPSVHTGDEKSVFFNFDGTIDSGEFLSCINDTISNFSQEKYSFIQDEVIHIENTTNGQSVKCKSGKKFYANDIIFSTGAFYTQLHNTILSKKSTNFALYSGRGIGLHLSKIIELTNGIRTPNRDYACGLHLLPNDSMTYLGATNRLTFFPDVHEKFPYINEHQFLINSSIQELNSSIKQTSHLKSLVGYRPLLVDRRPIVGKLDDGLWIASGTYRNGMLLSPLIGKEISNAIFENIEPRKYWNSNRDLIGEFRNPLYLNNENWVKNIKSEMSHHVSRRGEIFNAKSNRKALDIDEYCDFIYNEVLIAQNIESDNKYICKTRKLFHEAPMRENIPRVLNLLLSEYDIN